LDKKLT